MHFSTNYVFDGRTHGQVYAQADAANPINVYGKTKLAGEQAVLSANPRSYIVRTSWVFGVGKQNFLSTVHRQLLAGHRVQAIADVWASATYVVDLVARVAEVLRHKRYGVYQLVNAGVLSYHDFAVEAARLVGLNGEAAARLIEQVSEDEAMRLAERPRHTPMRCVVVRRVGPDADARLAGGFG
jgi:dTDP-4-dehydrorhamnose reductase